MRLVLLAHSAHKRVASLQAALAALGLPAATVVAWRDWLSRPECLTTRLDEPCWLKLEAPGEDEATQRLLIARGAELAGAPAPRPLGYGEIGDGAFCFEGFESALADLARTLAARPWVRCVNSPESIRLMCDKLACQRHLLAAGVEVPTLLGAVADFAELRQTMAERGARRVFVKPRYGSTASGVVALETDGGSRWLATSSAEMTGEARPRLFNSRRVRRYRDAAAARLIDALAPERLYAEVWIPKPSWSGRGFDIRLVTLAGRPAHRVARLSSQPMTNLHLGAERGRVEERLSPAAVTALEAAAARVARSFPQALVAGVDLIATERRVSVLEVNAFGDWLPRLLWRDRSVHAEEIELLLGLEAGRSGCPAPFPLAEPL